MNAKNRAICASALLALAVVGATAQSGTNSPYSQYGLGQMTDQGTGFNRGMNGLAQGFREHNQVNHLNPASYSGVDSLTFIFDAGFSGQITNFSENGRKQNAKNADFEYAVAAFRVMKHVGVSFGILPYSNIGYSYYTSGNIAGDASNVYSTSYYGEGGLHQVYLGAGWEPLRGLSVGFNVAYLWGNLSRTVTNSYTDSWAKTVSKVYSASVTNYRLDVGLQYQLNLSKKDQLTIGATYSPGHKLGADPSCKVISTNPSTSVTDTAAYSVSNALEIPTSISAGLAYNRLNKLKLGVDYSYQNWGSISYPVYTIENQVPSYKLSSKYYTNRHRLTIGGEYCPQEGSRSFLKRMHFRAGASYATPYYKINGNDGPKEISVSAGFGIPIVNAYNNRSILNISAQWVRNEAKNYITENTFRINVGLTFNERWFMKWKVE